MCASLLTGKIRGVASTTAISGCFVASSVAGEVIDSQSAFRRLDQSSNRFLGTPRAAASKIWPFATDVFGHAMGMGLILEVLLLILLFGGIGRLIHPALSV